MIQINVKTDPFNKEQEPVKDGMVRLGVIQCLTHFM